jgi:hypothetical protein
MRDGRPLRWHLGGSWYLPLFPGRPDPYRFRIRTVDGYPL